LLFNFDENRFLVIFLARAKRGLKKSDRAFSIDLLTPPILFAKSLARTVLANIALYAH